MINTILNHSILDRYLKQILPTVDITVRIKPMYYNFRCNVCMDSKKDKRKKRGYVLKSKYPWMYHCHNCNVQMPAEKWLKEYFPAQYREYIKEILQQKEVKKDDKAEFEELNKVKKAIEDEQNKKDEKEKEDIKHFISLNSKNIQHKKIVDTAIQFCENRKISRDIWKTWYVATKDSKTFYNRLIIPFYDNEKHIYYWQGRTLSNQIPKYLNRTIGKEKAVYNFYNIDNTKPINVLEGPINSLFIENSIATCGLSIISEIQKKLDKLNCYYIFDADLPGRKKAKKYLLENKKVFLWKKFIDYYKLPKRNKWDINDVYIYLKRNKNFTFDDIKEFYSSSIFDEIYL